MQAQTSERECVVTEGVQHFIGVCPRRCMGCTAFRGRCPPRPPPSNSSLHSPTSSPRRRRRPCSSTHPAPGGSPGTTHLSACVSEHQQPRPLRLRARRPRRPQ
ncbi:hypothetical protein MSAN_02445000 [Mycena sanguinolenta]|uniref:Uncharacterized protein n=1 Tax=Mycena sanguinolenta TaxID=230812 RepID=A0A8H6WYB2_9AGAR|nr:hypothetical protein MSAN_02445000 [Mycena sanguinolenta]